MPELPEIETIRRGIKPHINNQQFQAIIIRNASLRWPVAANIGQRLRGQKLLSVERRAKYLLLKTHSHCLIIHLGMSGSLKITNASVEPEKHDHVDICFDNGVIVRYNDPRRFGAILLTGQNPLQHKLLACLGIEPFDKLFNGKYLYDLSRNKKQCIKSFVMNAQVVAGVGNIYANEALFRSAIHPKRSAGRISCTRYDKLASQIQKTLELAIEAGGSTIRDFTNSEGKPGYFSQQLFVYGLAGKPCRVCNHPIISKRINQRNTFYCATCQR